MSSRASTASSACSAPAGWASSSPRTGQQCGRAVYGDLHVGGTPTPPDTFPTPAGCANDPLSPQALALEYMLFDLSSCLTPWTP